MERRVSLLLSIWWFWCLLGVPALKINVRANGDSEDSSSGSYRQDIIGNSSTETVLIQYSLDEGTLVSQLTDFRTSTQIVRVYIPGEEDLGEPLFQSFCFVSLYGGDLIPPEAVHKLRQKHPQAIRLAEQDNGEIVMDASLRLAQTVSSPISSHLSAFCNESSTLSSHHELYSILEKGVGTSSRVEDLSRSSVSNYEALPRCYGDKGPSSPCICSLRVCFNWFPCALKYCGNKDGEGEHRCGIKTCRKCSTFRYAVLSKSHCHWDEI